METQATIPHGTAIPHSYWSDRHSWDHRLRVRSFMEIFFIQILLFRHFSNVGKLPVYVDYENPPQIRLSDKSWRAKVDRAKAYVPSNTGQHLHHLTFQMYSLLLPNYLSWIWLRSSVWTAMQSACVSLPWSESAIKRKNIDSIKNLYLQIRFFSHIKKNISYFHVSSFVLIPQNDLSFKQCKLFFF